MNDQSKIVNLETLKEYIQNEKAKNHKVVLCQGHFNIIHPGHLRFIDFAKSLGDVLIVAVHGYNHIEDKNKGVFFDEKERARGVTSLYKVNKVIILDKVSIMDVISTIKPDIYAKGAEFKNNKESQEDIKFVESLGGKTVFNSGQIEYNTTEFLDNDIECLTEKKNSLFRSALRRQKIDYDELLDHIENFKNLNILIIGDTIVDEYIACDAVGMSAEAPVLNIREIEKKTYIGGAAIVSHHIRALGAKSHFISVIGDDEPGRFVSSELQKNDIQTRLIINKDRETTFKMRYMVGKQKLLRVSRFHEHRIDEQDDAKIRDQVTKLAPNLNGIILSDFSNGVITNDLCEFLVGIASKYDIKLFGDSQTSSQIGDIMKFKNFDLITPTEREARVALSDNFSGLEKIGITILDKTKVKNLAITLSERGFISYQTIASDKYNDKVIKSQHFPALNVNPVDVVGAGDSLLSGFALALSGGANLMEASVIASAVASISVNNFGNVPIKLEELRKYFNSIKNDFSNEEVKEITWKK